MTKHLSIFALAATFAVSAFAADTPAPATGNSQPRQPAAAQAETSDFSDLDLHSRARLMRRFDKDGDGKLSEAERAEAVKALKAKSGHFKEMRKKFVSGVIAKFDKDGDGKLDEAELTEFLEDQRKAFESCRRPGRPPRDFNAPKEILAKFDKDGDGFLNPQERRAMFEQARQKRDALFKKYDADGDGKLSDEEKNKMLQDPEVREMLKRIIDNPPPPPQFGGDRDLSKFGGDCKRPQFGERPDRPYRPDFRARRGDCPKFRHPREFDSRCAPRPQCPPPPPPCGMDGFRQCPPPPPPACACSAVRPQHCPPPPPPCNCNRAPKCPPPSAMQSPDFRGCFPQPKNMRGEECKTVKCAGENKCAPAAQSVDK